MTNFSYSDHDLLQWSDRPQGFSLFGELPILLKFLLVESIPFQHVSKTPPWKFPLHYTVPDAHCYLVFTICCVEMGRPMIAVENSDHDTKKAADLRQHTILPHTPMICGTT